MPVDRGPADVAGSAVEASSQRIGVAKPSRDVISCVEENLLRAISIKVRWWDDLHWCRTPAYGQCFGARRLSLQRF